MSQHQRPLLIEVGGFRLALVGLGRIGIPGRGYQGFQQPNDQIATAAQTPLLLESIEPVQQVGRKLEADAFALNRFAHAS